MDLPFCRMRMRQVMVVTMMRTKVNQRGSSSSINHWTLEVVESEELESDLLFS